MIPRPPDPGLSSQWALSQAALNVQPVWDDYRGEGVIVGVIDDGVDHTHPELHDTYRHDLDYDARDHDNDALSSAPDDGHGTAVAGVIAAAANGSGMVGVAPKAQIVGFRIAYDDTADSSIADQFARMGQVDVVNNSWGYTGYFYDDLDSLAFAGQRDGLITAVAQGRDGLGTVVVFAAGNGADEGQNTNYHGLQNSQYVITVGATDKNGAIAWFSTPGANVLVAAPGVEILTTDNVGAAGYVSGNYALASGTSFAAPAVAEVVALMLEANPALGYRDVQEILAYAARNPTANTTGWMVNGARNWNGRGLLVSDTYGFGLVEARAVVRLAETWEIQSTYASQVSVTASRAPDLAIDDHSTVTDPVRIGEDLVIDHVEVRLDLAHSWVGDLRVTLTSPSGTVSTLVYDPGGGGADQQDIRFTLSSVQFWGENGLGTWQLAVTDTTGYDTGRLNSWELSLFGDAVGTDDVFLFTDSWGTVGADPARQIVHDSVSADTLNFAAFTQGVTVSLVPGASNTVLGRTLALSAETVIESLFGGDGNDTLTGNAADNLLYGARGNDTLHGGDGLDTALFLGPLGDYTLKRTGNKVEVIAGAVRGTEGRDVLFDIEQIQFADILFADSSNRAPVAGKASFVGTEDTPLTGRLSASDADGDAVMFVLNGGRQPHNGWVHVDADGRFSYHPDPDFFGEDTFGYYAFDDFGGGSEETVTLTVKGVNDAPVPHNQLLPFLIPAEQAPPPPGGGGGGGVASLWLDGGAGNDVLMGGGAATIF
ncbi:MAG: peptidase S8/S53 subtilisin kexin sedolisin [Rhodospirillaceae bacterium]|nr:MAG: peptidase S8/S53 subtilisin kexin sedolisin [Rhodospirillaceae bacterium]